MCKQITHALLSIALFSLFLYSCSTDTGMIGCYEVNADTVSMELLDWKVEGPFKAGRVRDKESKLWYDALYSPKYGQLDLKEVFNISVTDTVKQLDGLFTYLSCTLKADRERDMFLFIRTKMESEEYINGDTLKNIDIKDMKALPVHLKAGDNNLVVKTQGTGLDYWYEATLYDSVSMARLYAEEHTGNIIYPVIDKDSIVLTDSHCSMMSQPIVLQFHDVYGKQVAETIIKKNKDGRYLVNGLEKDRSYICSMIMAGDTVRQPVVTGAFETLETKFKALRDSLPDNHPRADEIDQLLYRVWKLNMLTGKMREEHWFPFKLPWVTYQLEHTFAHIDGTYGNDEGENNFKFITYRSSLDGCLQRYLLVTPNNVDKEKKYPLVVVMRPCSEKRYHLYFSPQIAHQFVVNDMQAVANKYKIFIIMPEARMMLNEDMIPFAEAEMKLALEDVKEHYNIDEQRIYLHANCSGGYRALRFATYNPDLFAAIALYAPVYKRPEGAFSECTPETMLKNLRNTPLLIFGDPADTHSPVNGYADLIKDCEKYGVPYTLHVRRNSGLGYHGYHRLIVGRDACEYFKDKKREPAGHTKYSFPPCDTTVADFYSQPFVYVYNASDTSAVYRTLVTDIQNEYEDYLYARLPLEKQTIVPHMPLIPDTRVTEKMLKEKNVFLIGDRFICDKVKAYSALVKVTAVYDKHAYDVFLTLCKNPYSKERMTLLYTSKRGPHFKHVISCPWKSGLQRTLTSKFKKDEEKGH